MVGDVATILGLTAEALDEACEGARVARTVLRSEALRIVRGEPLDLLITSSGSAFLLTDEFLAAFAGRAEGLAMLVATRRPDPAALARLREVGVRAEFVQIPASAESLRERVAAALRAARAPPAIVTPPRGPPAGPESQHADTRVKVGDRDMANINKTIEEAMKIDGAIAVAVADWDSGLCLGMGGGGARLNIEIAAAGNCQVVKAKMATMSELGIKGAIQDILITLDDQIHLIRPLRRGENLFLYLAIDKAKGNLAMARHRLQKLESELSM